MSLTDEFFSNNNLGKYYYTIDTFNISSRTKTSVLITDESISNERKHVNHTLEHQLCLNELQP